MPQLMNLRDFIGNKFFANKFKPASKKNIKQTLTEVRVFCEDYWITGAACRSDGPINACLIGAVALSCGWDPTVWVDEKGNFSDGGISIEAFPTKSGRNLYEKTIKHLALHNPETDEYFKDFDPDIRRNLDVDSAEDAVITYNDQKERKREEILATLDKAIKAI